MWAATLGSSFERSGPGVHLGVEARVRVGPAPPGSGLQVILGEGAPFRVGPSTARAEPGCTVLTDGRAELRTPEHLLAALYGCGITDARVAVRGPEVPILDGSAAPWCAAILDAGRVPLGPIAALTLDEPVRIEAFGGVAEAWPAAEPSAEVEVDFGARGPSGVGSVVLDGERFAREVAWARTFALADELEALRAAGRGLGATADNTVVWGADGPRTPARSLDEAVRHKLVDLVGDLALCGRPLLARVRVSRGSHRLHHALVQRIATR